MFTIFIALILIAIGSDWERAEEAKERRHRELMELEKRKRANNRRKVTRTVAKDGSGRVLAQEIIEDSGDDYE